MSERLVTLLVEALVAVEDPFLVPEQELDRYERQHGRLSGQELAALYAAERIRHAIIIASFPVGARVRLTCDVQRYPHFIAPAGSKGTVVESSDEIVSVRLDRRLAGAEEWDNEVCWYPRNCDDDPSLDAEVIAEKRGWLACLRSRLGLG